MAQATIIFEDSEEGTRIGMDVPDIDEQQEMTPALFNAALISFIIEKNYHLQFKEEFIKLYEEEMKNEESGE
jgi:hypothetical protein